MCHLSSHSVSIDSTNTLDLLACAYDFCRYVSRGHARPAAAGLHLGAYEQLGGRILPSERATAGVIVPDVFDAIMQTDPIRWQEETITAVIVVLLTSLCLCAEAGVSREDAREGWKSGPQPSFLFF